MLTPTSVPGVLAGHWTHSDGTTGVTVLRFPGGAHAAVALPGHAPGSRELGTLRPHALADKVHAVCLCGGSAYGLAAAQGVMEVLEEAGEGFETPGGRVPIVPAAVLYDLGLSPTRPDAQAGASAARACSAAPLAEGRVGAAAGGTVGKAHGNVARGGTGCGGERVGEWTMAAVVAVNAFGGVRDLRGRWVKGGPLEDTVVMDAPLGRRPRGNTTLACVVTDAPLSRAQCQVLADMATAGLARTLDPAFTAFDGDTVFGVSTSTEGAAGADRVDPLQLTRLGAAAARVVAAAVLRAVRPSR